MNPASAQERLQFKSAGALAGFGNTFSDNTVYQVIYFMGDWSRSFHRSPGKNDFMGWYCDPQFNLVKANDREKSFTDIEFGINLGLRNYIKVGRRSYLYQMLGAGPHYITARLVRQARGFLFSDNLAAGGFLHLKNETFLNLQFGIRHISNANLKLPNRGVNSYNMMMGISGIL